LTLPSSVSRSPVLPARPCGHIQIALLSDSETTADTGGDWNRASIVGRRAGGDSGGPTGTGERWWRPGGGHVGDVREVRCPRRGFDRGIAPATTGAREGGQCGAGLTNEDGLEGASAEATNALMESHSRHMRMERLLKGAGLASEDTHPPEYLPLLVAGRRSAVAQAGTQVSVREAEEDDDEEIDRGIGA
jgi:hypothetical protein